MLLIIIAMKAIFAKHQLTGGSQEHNKNRQGKNLPPEPVVLDPVLHDPGAVQWQACGDEAQGYTGIGFLHAGNLPGKEAGFTMGMLRESAAKHTEQQKEKKGSMQTPKVFYTFLHHWR